MNELHIKTIIYATALAFATIMLIHHVTPQAAWLEYLSNASALVLVGVMVFDRFLWKWSLLHGWFVKRPVIDGTWRVELRSDWIDPSTNTSMAPIEAYVVIRQTFSTLGLRLLTADSSSELVGIEIVCSMDGLYCITGVYRNEPRYLVRDRSPIHYGAIWLRVVPEPGTKLVGHYWTDRKTGGELETTGRKKNKVLTFESGRILFGEQPS